MAIFPNGSNDDIEDAFSQGINWLRGHNYHYGLLGYAAQQVAAQQQKAQDFMESAKTVVKPDRGVQSIQCEACKSYAVVRIGNDYHCNSCRRNWPAVKTADFDPKIYARNNAGQVRK